jgi:hypothetical protein
MVDEDRAVENTTRVGWREKVWVVCLAQQEWVVGGGIWVANKFVGSSR